MRICCRDDTSIIALSWITPKQMTRMLQFREIPLRNPLCLIIAARNTALLNESFCFESDFEICEAHEPNVTPSAMSCETHVPNVTHNAVSCETHVPNVTRSAVSCETHVPNVTHNAVSCETHVPNVTHNAV